MIDKPFAPQLAACAARLPEPQRSEFIAAMQRARELHFQAAEIRSAAWAVYRSVTGRPKRVRK